MRKVGTVLIMFLCGALGAISFNWLLIPHGLVAGGLSGVAMVLGYLGAGKINILFLLLNIPIVVWGFYAIGRAFVFNSLICISTTVGFMEIIPLKAFAIDPLLSAVFGGVMVGLATGLALRNGGSTGGVDIVGSIVTRKRDFPIGMSLFTINGIIVVAIGFIKQDWNLALTSMLSIFITGKVVDMIHIRHVKITAFIVTCHKERLLEQLLRLPRGVTVLKTEGAYHHQEQAMLMTVTTRYELVELKKIVRSHDPRAFVNIVETVGVLGEFRR